MKNRKNTIFFKEITVLSVALLTCGIILAVATYWFTDNLNVKDFRSSPGTNNSANQLNLMKILEDALVKGDIKKADIVTDQIIRGELISTDISNLSCSNLIAIDDQWRMYSREKFGYGEQLKIWEQSKLRNPQNPYLDFVSRVEWYRDGIYLYPPDLNYTMNAEIGHLPWSGWQIEGKYRQGFAKFMDRLKNCKFNQARHSPVKGNI